MMKNRYDSMPHVYSCYTFNLDLNSIELIEVPEDLQF